MEINKLFEELQKNLEKELGATTIKGLSLKTHYRKLQELTKEFFKNEA